MGHEEGLIDSRCCHRSELIIQYGGHLLCQCLTWQSLCQILTTWYWTSQPSQQGAVLESPACRILFQQHNEWGTKAPLGRHCSLCIHSPGTEEPGSHILLEDTDDTPYSRSLSPQQRNKLKRSVVWKRSRLLKSFQLFFCLSWQLSFVFIDTLICYSIAGLGLSVLVNQIITLRWNDTSVSRAVFKNLYDLSYYKKISKCELTVL